MAQVTAVRDVILGLHERYIDREQQVESEFDIIEAHLEGLYAERKRLRELRDQDREREGYVHDGFAVRTGNADMDFEDDTGDACASRLFEINCTISELEAQLSNLCEEKLELMNELANVRTVQRDLDPYGFYHFINDVFPDVTGNADEQWDDEDSSFPDCHY